MRRVLALAALLCLVSHGALARVERFAVVVGNNRGASDEAPLRYAETDAGRVYEVLLQLGDFSPVNAVLLRGQDAATVRNTLLAINERIRDETSIPDTQVVLVVYFSGHADAQALHLRGTELAVSELRQLARGSAANFRLVVLDACRSGALTRVKGGQRAPAFALPAEAQESLPGDGLAFLTASSAHEDAQESDELQGAFFTHALISGLLGAADADGDGAVVLDEVYRYAYETTLRANLAHGPEGGMSLRSPLLNADGVCLGAFVGYALDIGRFGVRARFSTCASQLANRVVQATVLAHDLQLNVYHAWDVSLATFEVSLGSGLSLFDQHFETRAQRAGRAGGRTLWKSRQLYGVRQR